MSETAIHVMGMDLLIVRLRGFTDKDGDLLPEFTVELDAPMVPGDPIIVKDVEIGPGMLTNIPAIAKAVIDKGVELPGAILALAGIGDDD